MKNFVNEKISLMKNFISKEINDLIINFLYRGRQIAYKMHKIKTKIFQFITKIINLSLNNLI